MDKNFSGIEPSKFEDVVSEETSDTLTVRCAIPPYSANPENRDSRAYVDAAAIAKQVL
jgi:hypothetical protein